MSRDNLKEAVANYFAAIRNMDTDAFVNVFAADGESHDPVGAPPFQGHDGLRKFFRGIEATFSQLTMTETAVYINKNEAAVHWQAEGIGKNGKTAQFSGINLFVFNPDGEISNLRAYWNPRAMMAQLKE
ncbi:nuclear transport factor 2 family protein [Candidatus Leptofilum sp.]|uniref:nuclear transport factor 2 family protein n=1 Tax=Candidatus Leptofilum sp. TaxID=3241576 RepID=UPI003B5BC407